jgi:hypothetical protein
MAKFEKFDSRKQIRGLAEAARQIQIEELIRDGKMVSLDQVVAAIGEVREVYRPKILAARQKKLAGSKREREASRRVK